VRRSDVVFAPLLNRPQARIDQLCRQTPNCEPIDRPIHDRCRVRSHDLETQPGSIGRLEFVRERVGLIETKDAAGDGRLQPLARLDFLNGLMDDDRDRPDPAPPTNLLAELRVVGL